MKRKLHVYYDEEGDFLEITSGDIRECYFDNKGEGIFEIIDKATKETKGVAIHHFRMRAKNLKEINISLPLYSA